MNMSERLTSKKHVWDFIWEMEKAETEKMPEILEKYCDKQAVFEIYHPFNTQNGTDKVFKNFWSPLMTAIPDMERRIDIFAGDMYKDEYWVTSMGHLLGNFKKSWLGVPPTGRIAALRFGEFYKIEKGKIVKAHIHLDIPDFMWQAGVYPFREMLGRAGVQPGPRMHNGLRLGEDDPKQDALDVVLSMHKALHDFDGKDLKSMDHSQFWSKNFNYYASSGIGATRGIDAFRNFHQRPFLISFPDRHGTEHYCRISDGPVACTTHWGTLTATHLGSSWLGLPATGTKLKMRVADWYCTDEEGKLKENWLFIDIPRICHQMGYDIFDTLAFITLRS